MAHVFDILAVSLSSAWYHIIEYSKKLIEDLSDSVHKAGMKNTGDVKRDVRGGTYTLVEEEERKIKFIFLDTKLIPNMWIIISWI